MRYSTSDNQFIHDISQANSIPHLIELKLLLEQNKLYEISRQHSNQNVIDMYTRSIKIVEDRIKHLTDHSADKPNSL